MSSTKSKGRGTRAGFSKLDVSAPRSRLTTNDFANEEGDVPKNLPAFRATVWEHYKKHGRNDLPWRKTKDPYKILVSEVMLQQTQVLRVIEKYQLFLRAFPNVRRLAEAKLSDVLKVWSGMGYNRRAKYLRAAAETIVRGYGGRVPKAAVVLRGLPGVGPYTANAVRVFAFNEPDVLIETNIRTAYIHHFYSSVLPARAGGQKTAISDKEILEIAQKAAAGQDPRQWHWALMDYGAYLKKSGVRNNHQSAQYNKQSKFEGSLRQVRGAILRELHKGTSSLHNRPRFNLGQMKKALESLERDGLIVEVKRSARDRLALGRKWRIA